jgi:hypothetical protein
MEFSGKAVPLTNDGFRSAKDFSGVDDATLWAILSVETSGCGFLPDRRPKILFERHIFSRLTSGRFDADDPDVSAPTPGGYGLGGAHQYMRLQSAIDLDEEAALMSASWGLGQVMGENATAIGFASVEEMISGMVDGEDGQLDAVVRFIKKNRMDQPLASHDWAAFARRYNGPNYAANNYDGLLDHFYQQYAKGPLPDLVVRAAQVQLMFRGFNPGPIDGLAGTLTTRAVIQFQKQQDVEPTGTIDDKLLELLAGT